MSRPIKPITYKIDKNGCYICTSHKPKSKGYCQITRKGIMLHRYIYEKKVGSIPKDMCVCHSCDVKICINPKHLFLGTQNDNMQDKVKKRRQTKGIEVNTAKLTKRQVKEIRRSNKSLTKLSKIYSMSISNLWKIKKGLIWRSV